MAEYNLFITVRPALPTQGLDEPAVPRNSKSRALSATKAATAPRLAPVC